MTFFLFGENMARKTIKISLFDGGKSLQQAIRQIEQHKNDLPKQCEEICRRLSEMGKQAALVAINEIPQGKAVTLRMDMDSSKTGCKAMLITTGKTVTDADGRSFNLLLAIEFGAGIRYNPKSNPKANEFEMGVGTFPDQTHAFDSNGWYYLGDDGEWHHSYGVKATMPMYRAGAEIKKNIDKVVREVFK